MDKIINEFMAKVIGTERFKAELRESIQKCLSYGYGQKSFKEELMRCEINAKLAQRNKPYQGIHLGMAGAKNQVR